MEDQQKISATDELAAAQPQKVLEDNGGNQQGRKRVRNESNWLRNVNKHARSHGLEYVTRKGKQVPKKAPLPSKCSCRYRCKEFSEEARSIICDEFYAIGDRSRQKDFIISKIVIEPVKRRVKVRKNEERKMRGNSYIYTLGLCNKDGVPEMVRVCQHFFCKTLAVSSETVRNALSNVGVAGNYVGKDKRQGRQAKNKLDEERKNFVKDHINSFPRIEPHYCRKDGSKQYLSPELNVVKMYRLYLERCREKEVEPVKESMYRHIFVTDFNLQFFPPKKAECNKYGNAVEVDKDEHRQNCEEPKQRENEALEEMVTISWKI